MSFDDIPEDKEESYPCDALESDTLGEELPKKDIKEARKLAKKLRQCKMPEGER